MPLVNYLRVIDCEHVQQTEIKAIEEATEVTRGNL